MTRTRRSDAPLRPRRRPRPRTLAVLALLIALTTTNTVLEAVNQATFPTVTRTGVAHPASETTPEQAYWVFFPGFGIDFCGDVERSLSEVTAATGRSFCVAPSPSRLDPAEIARAVRDRIDRERTQDSPVTLYLYGISMGGMLAYDVARQLDGRHEITIGAIVFDSSPGGPESVAGVKQVGVRVGATLNRLPDLPGDIPNPLKGGPLNRAGLHIAEAALGNLTQRHWPLTPDDLRTAWGKATVVTSEGMANQLGYINSFYPTPDPAALPHARFAYLRAQEDNADTTTDVRRAVQTYASLVSPQQLTVYPIVGGRHASADVTAASYRNALAAFIAASALPTSTDVARAEQLERFVIGR